MKHTFSILLMLAFVQADAQQKTKITSSLFGMLEARHIGPAVMGGRITAIDAVNSDSRIVYIGTAGGGIWKTTTGCSYFKPVFDKHVQSIGALTVDQNKPDIVWAGTGESNMRNSVSIGNGLYKSTDGGDNWIKVGLDSSEHISRIAIHPTNSEIVYVAVPGPLWSNSTHRGLYKTTDGGKTWEKIHYVNEKTGCAEVLIDPKNPETIYATTWEFRRTPYSFSSGGKGSGIFKSSDGGKTWKKLTNGLPTGEFGRVAMALAPSKPENLFAIVEAKQTSLFLSTDGGESWKEQSSTYNVAGRPFYFSVISVDPLNPNRVYRPAWTLSMSDDGGKSFSEASMEGGWVHADHHALWINPNNTSHLYLGTDGGVYMSLDKGNNWIFLNNLPVSQFYHVAVDRETPYNVYGGLQDNGSWMGPSEANGGIKNGDWKNVGFGDGFWVQPDGEDKDILYSEYQGGKASRLNRRTNEYADIQPQPLAGEPKLRFNWNTPICVSPTNPKTLYMGAQYLYRSRNKGITWERISPDLTTNDPAKQDQEASGGITTDNSSAENHCTIFSIAESPFDENMIYAGTDDGNLQVTTDGGKSWTKISANITGVPPQTWVSSIEPSKFDKNTVYVTFDNHNYGDMKTYCAVSRDAGKSWSLLNTTSLSAGYAHKIFQDPVKSNLLFLGAELGLFVSFDEGQEWVQFSAKVPPVAVRDIVMHRGTNDLVLATHGRGILIIDDISPLRMISPEVLEKPVAILTSGTFPARDGKYGSAYPQAGGFVGDNSSELPGIVYYLKDRVTSGTVKIEVFNADGQLVGTVPATKRKGINIARWSMRQKPPRVARGIRLDFAGFVGPMSPPGEYTVKISVNDAQYTEKITLIKDPASAHSDEDLALQQKTVKELYSMSEDLALFNEQVLRMRDDAKAGADTVKDASLRKSLSVLSDRMESIRKSLIATKESMGITGEERLRERLSELYASVAGYDGRPNDSQLSRMKSLAIEIDDEKKKARAIWSKDLEKLNASLSKKNMKPLSVLSKEEFEKSDNGISSGSGKGMKLLFPFTISLN